MVYTIIYFDKEYEKMKYYQSSYASIKVTELMLNSVQSYTSNVASNHITTGLGLMESFQTISDDAFQYLINPNISILTSLGMSSLVNINNENLKDESFLKQSYYITENAIKVNVVNIIQYHKLTNYDFVHQLASNLSNIIAHASYGMNSFDILHSNIYAIHYISHMFVIHYQNYMHYDITLIS